MKIGIDAGHGLNTPGKRCAKQFDTNETREWVLNNRVATKVCEILNRSGLETIRLDDITGNTDIPLSTRCRTANNTNVDLVVSIHHNAGGGTGIETYVYNQACLNGETGRMATIINNKAVEKTGMRNRGVKTKDLAMVRDTKMPACLIECGFMDNEHDTPIILTEEYAIKVANGIIEGILSYCNIEKKETDPGQQSVQPTKSIVDLANEVIAGKYGTGEARKQALGSLYNDVQAKVNEILKGKVSAQPSRKSNEEIAKEVIDGKWDKGQARKDKLVKAGYDYNAIQKIVNAKLR